MRIYASLMSGLLLLFILLVPVANAGPKDKKGADGWLARSQRQYLEYKFKQDHGYAPSGHAEIRAHELYPHVDPPPQAYRGATVYWNGYAWVVIQN